MKVLIIAPLLAALLQTPTFHVEQKTLQLPDGTTLLYGLATPRDLDPKQPRPLVLALHPGGTKTPYYGAQYLRSVFLPGLRDLNPVMVAPDCPTNAWSDPVAERAVLALVQSVTLDYAIDHRRILVVGFSLGGRGVWFMEAHHSDLFSAAVVMAGSTDEPLDKLATIPTYVIHSRADEVVPFAQAEQRVTTLERLGRPVMFEALEGVGHFDMGGYVPALTRAGAWMSERWKK